MMTKFVSLLLSFTLIFMSVAPSYAQASASSDRYRRMSSRLEGLDKKIYQKQFTARQDTTDPMHLPGYRNMMLQMQMEEDLRQRQAVEQVLQEFYVALTSTEDTSGEGVSSEEHVLDFNEFKTAYLEDLANEEKLLIRQSKSNNERLLIQNEFKKFREHSALQAAYLRAEDFLRKDMQENPQKYQDQILRMVTDLVFANLQSSKMAQTLLPVLAAYGFLNPQERKRAAEFYRERLETFSSSCGGLSFWNSLSGSALASAQRKCEEALASASSLSVVGENYSDDGKDALALYNFLMIGYNGIAAPMVVQVVAQGMLALNAERLLGSALKTISKKETFKPIDVTLAMLSVQTYVELFQVLANSENGFGTATFAEGLEYSFYSNPDSSYGNKRNMWIDLGETLAEMSRDPEEERREAIASALSYALEGCIWPDSYGNLAVDFRPFVVGALAGGYDVKLETPRAEQVYNENGTVSTIQPNVSAWNKLRNWIHATGFTNSEYISWYLYSLNKIDLDPATEQYINNLLTAAHVGAARRAGRSLEPEQTGEVTRYVIGLGENHTPLVIESRSHASPAAVAAHNNRQNWIKIGVGADIVIAVFALFSIAKLGLTAAKWGANALRTGTRVLKLARAGQLVSGGSLHMNVVRVVSRARTIHHLPSIRSAMAAGVANAAGIRRMKIEPLIKELRATRTVKPVKAPKPAAPKSQVRTLNGEKYIVFEGTETVYVQGRVTYVDKGTDLASIARKYNVPESEVAWARDGSTWASAQKPAFNFGAGEAAPGSRGVQPRMDRPDIRIPKPVSRVEPVKPVAEASMVKPGEKLAYIYEGGAWRIESVPQELSRADVAKRFKINVDDVDYVVSLSDGTLAPEWTEFIDVWEVARMPHGQPVRKFEITGWNLFKARIQTNWSLLTDNLFSVSDFALRNPLRASGMGLSSFGLGGVAPLSLPATVQVAPAAANPLTSFRLLETVSEVPATLRAPASLSSSTTALQTASVANTGLQGSRMWLNPFWLLPGGAVTSRHITPVGALPSDSFRGGSLFKTGTSSKWQSKAAFDNYRLQTDNWLFRSNPLYRAQNPWLLGQWWDDVKNSISLDWQEFNLSRASNPYYVGFKTSLLTTPALDAAEEPAALPADQTPAPAVTAAPSSSSSGYLYSGLPIMELPRMASSLWKTLRGLFGGKADVLAEDILSRKVPLVTELRDIVTGNANLALKKKALLRLHQQFNAFDQVVKNLPAQARAHLKALEERQAAEEIGNFLYNLYETGFLDQVLPRLSNHIPTELLAQTLDEIISNPEFEATRRAVYDNTPVLSLDSNDWQGFVKSVQNVNPKLISDISRKEGWAVQNASDGKEVSGGWIYYENDIPVYYRHANGVLSDSPVIILHQEPFSSKLAGVYASFWQALHLSSQAGVKIPKGMVLALDENGKFKYVLRPGHRAELQDSKAAQKIMKDIYEKGSVSVDLETPYNTTDLLAIAKLLEAGVETNFQLTMAAPNSFKQFVYSLGMLSGLGVDQVMVGPFREAAGPDNPAVPNAFGGVGYVTPRVAAELMTSIKAFGVDRSIFTVLAGMMATLGVSVAFGINGLIPITQFSLFALGAPLLLLIVTGSILRSVIPLILNVYKDPQQRTAANLQVSAFQQGSKVGLSGVTGLWRGAGEKFVAVPLAALLTLASIGLFLNTPIGRKVMSETLTAALKHPMQSLKQLGKGSKIVLSKILKGVFLGALTPPIFIGKKAAQGFKWLVNKFGIGEKATQGFEWLVNKFRKPKAAKKTGEETKSAPELADVERYAQEYETEFAADPEVKGSLSRVTIAYASYAASLMLLNQLAEGPAEAWIAAGLGYEGWGKIATTLFALSSFTVRLFASKWVRSGKFTDDQLTGISFAGLALPALLLACIPYESWGLVGVLLFGLLLNMSTAVPGQLDQTRLQNLVSAKIQAQKNAVLQDDSLSQAEKDAKIADLESKGSSWSGWAKAAYDKANANGIWGVYIAVLASLGLPALNVQDWSWIARLVFLYAGGVASVGAIKTKEMSSSFIKALFRKKKALVITDEDIAAGQVSAASFGLTDENKVNKLVPSLMKGNDGLKALKEQVAPYGVIAIASEVKLTKVLKRMIEIHNRLVASSEVAGDAAMRTSFEELHSLAADYAAVMEQSNVSTSLQREFGKLLAALCVEGSLEKGVLAKPSYMREGEFDIPANYRNLLEARDIILEMRVLVRNIRQGGSAVTPETYRQFIEYHTEAKRLLQAYMAENPSESAIVREEEENIRKLCRGLKMSNARSNILRQQEGHVAAKDIQDLEDLLLAY